MSSLANTPPASAGRLAKLPPQLHVFVRDWLSSNNVLLRSRDGHVLIDSGYVRHAPLTLALLASPQGLGDEPLARLVNTHAHSDHVGGNARIAARYGCPIAVPAAEAQRFEDWDDPSLLYAYAAQDVERFEVTERIEAGSTHVWGDLEWQALAAPGHDMAALVFFNPEHRILVSGDALWQRGFGFVMPRAVDPAALPATRATLDLIASLDARLVIPGHGEPFDDVDAAIENAYGRLSAFEADDIRAARHALRVVLMFHLLDRRSMALEDLPVFVQRIGLFRDLNQAVLRMTPDALATMLVGQLEAAGAARRVDSRLVPAG